MIIGKKTLRQLITEKELITEYVDLETQLQPNGFDLTLARIERLTGQGCLDFDNTKRTLSKGMEFEWLKWMNGDVYRVLESGYYRVTFNEKVKIPTDMCAFTYARSSLLRNGCSLESAVGDAGYEGAYQALLIVGPNGISIHKNARIAQLVFERLDEEQEPYNGIYHNKNQGNKTG